MSTMQTTPLAPSRRAWLIQATRFTTTATAASLLLGASGCGFQLRHGYTLAFKTVQLTGFERSSSVANELGRALEASGITVVDSTLAAVQAASASQVPNNHVVIEALTDRLDAVAGTTTAYGQIRNMVARNFLTFQVKRGDGSTLMPATAVSLSRDLSYNETDALAKQDELAALHRSMQTDMIDQVMRRLASITPAQLSDTRPPNVPPAPVYATSSPLAR